MTTYLIYFEDTYKFEDDAFIEATGKDENGDFIILNQTLFYPQGGGQPSDFGTIEVGGVAIPIYKVKCNANEVRHYTDQRYSHFVGQNAKCYLDQNTRILHARLHTAGHLLSNIIENLYSCWKGAKGHHFPGECYVEFTSKNDQFESISLDLVKQEIEKCIEANSLITIDQISSDALQERCPGITYSIPSNQPIRIMCIGDFPFSPCGGTHVKSLKELKGLEISKYKIKGNRMKVHYQLN